MSTSTNNLMKVNKEQRFNKMNEIRKQKREELIMQRRGLNFITESVIDTIGE